MQRSPARIPLGELVGHPARVLDRVVRERKPVLVEKRGKVLVLLTPVQARSTNRRRTSMTNRKAFLAAAGSWKRIDTDKFIADVYASRKRSSRPSVQL